MRNIGLHIQNILHSVLSYIFPQSTDAQTVSKLNESTMAEFYAPQRFDDRTTLSSYKDAQISALIHEAKFHGNKRAQQLLGLLLWHHLCTLPNLHTSVIIPIPLSKRRSRERGYNQVTKIITYAIPELHHRLLHTNILYRKRDTAAQTSLLRDARLKNMKDAFGVSDVTTVTGKHLIIIDDVTTTGATLHAAASALLPYSPASLRLIAIAH